MASDLLKPMRRRKGALIFGFLALVALWLVFQFSEIYFLRETADRGRIALHLRVENLKVWLDRYQSLPGIYAKSREVRAFLRDPNDPGLRQAANQFLVEANLSTGAADTYLLDREGTARAASNWDDEGSFVGLNYSFRPYFDEAMQGRLGRFFALGTVSGKRGYYFSHPVRDGTRIIGVVVIKIGVDAVEEALRASSHEVLVSDGNGVVLFAGNPAWRLKTLHDLEPAALARIARERQFEPGDLTPIDWRDRKPSVIDLPSLEAVPDRSDRRPRRFLLLSEPMPITGWQAHLLIDTGFARRQIAIVVGLAAFGLLAMGLLLQVVSERRRRFEDRLAAKEEARTRLEQAVAERTGDLRSANLKLEAEVGERKTAEEGLRKAQGELIQAGKLAALGQMSAALSHEFNQPLTAIRTYAENALAFLERGREEEARDNIGRVSEADRAHGLAFQTSFQLRPASRRIPCGRFPSRRRWPRRCPCSRVGLRRRIWSWNSICRKTRSGLSAVPFGSSK